MMDSPKAPRHPAAPAVPPPLPRAAIPPPPPTDEVRAQARKEGRGLVLHPVSWLFAVAAIAPGFVALVAVASRTTDPERIGRVAGGLTVQCLWIAAIYGIGWAVYKVCRQSKLAGNVAFCVLCSLWLALLVVLWGHMRSIHEGRDAEPARRIVVPKLRGEWEALVADYEDLSKPLVEAGGLEPGSLESPEDIQFRLGEIAKLIAANDELAQYLNGLEARTIAEYETAGLSPESAIAEAESFIAKSHIDLFLAVRDSDRRIWAAATELLSLLRDIWGQWEYDEATQMTMLPTDEAVEQFSKLQEEIAAASAEQARLAQTLKERRADD